MHCFTVPNIEELPEQSKPTLEKIERTLGVVPNLFKLLGSSPNVLGGFTQLQAALGQTLTAKTREAIALAVAQINGCQYCLSAHTYISEHMMHVAQEEILLNRKGRSLDPKVDAIVAFAASVVEKRGHVERSEIEVLRAKGVSDREVIEIVAVVAENVFTNLINEVAKTEIDFPQVEVNL
ncbi:carboxymuconolactone decarboxylase family protein [Vibrio vulnificus]|uniref:carboxymuconolactone decarboxylase family protein n=1 Tax=Vibrio vulnificus TaxID=672 RepID=UPI001CC939BD|nr:carboxymuconolactone decarboxylase family protein [Vibrio vulnificus]MCA0761763.1 carboxymuconolactone decarboxylase family protein [Vibrio vulnificus]